MKNFLEKIQIIVKELNEVEILINKAKKQLNEVEKLLNENN